MTFSAFSFFWRDSSVSASRQMCEERGGRGAMREEVQWERRAFHVMKRRHGKRGGCMTREATKHNNHLVRWERQHSKRGDERNERKPAREEAQWERRRRNKRGSMTREAAWWERRWQAQREICNQERRRRNERDHNAPREEVAARWERCEERGNKRNKIDAMREAAGMREGAARWESNDRDERACVTREREKRRAAWQKRLQVWQERCENCDKRGRGFWMVNDGHIEIHSKSGTNLDPNLDRGKIWIGWQPNRSRFFTKNKKEAI